MDALRRLLAPAVGMVNRQISASTPARELCRKLDGQAIAMRVRDTSLAVYLSVLDGRLEFSEADIGDPDVVITGSLVALGRLARANGEQLIRDGTVELQGDATVAEDFRRLLRYGKPDWEEQLSGVVGDVAAHGIGNVMRNVSRWGHDARQTFERNVGEYLQEESRALPGRHEVDAFRDRVHELRDDVARLDARLFRLENAAGDD